jgi:hypothetical protein
MRIKMLTVDYFVSQILAEIGINSEKWFYKKMAVDCLRSA